MSGLLNSAITIEPNLSAVIITSPAIESGISIDPSVTAVIDVAALLSGDVLAKVLVSGVPVFNYKFGDQAFADTVFLLSDGFQLELDSDNLILGDYTPEFLRSVGQ